MPNDRTVDMLLLFILSDNWGVGTLSFLRKTPLYLTPSTPFTSTREIVAWFALNEALIQ